MKQEQGISATRLRTILIVLVLLTIGISIGGFYYATGLLTSYAKATSDLNAKVAASDSTLQTLSNLKKRLELDAGIVEKTRTTIAIPVKNAYQDRMLTDLKNHAKNSDVVIEQIVFVETEAAPGQAGAVATAPAGVAAPVTGVKIVQADVTLNAPNSFDDVITFLKLVEQNSYFMNISNVTIENSSTRKTTDELTVGQISIQGFVRL